MNSHPANAPSIDSATLGSRAHTRHVIFPFVWNHLGGSFVSSALVIQQLNERDDLNVTVCLPHGGRNAQLFEDAGATVDDLELSPGHLDALHARRFRFQIGFHYHLHYRALDYLASVRPDLVHVNEDVALLSWGVAARRLGIPVLWHMRQEKRNRLDAIYRRIANKIVLIAESTRSRLSHAGPDAAVVVHNSTDTSSFAPPLDRARAKRYLGLDPNRLVVGFAGRMRPAKRPEWAVSACIDLLQKGRDIQLIVVGPDASDGRYDTELPRMVRDSGVESARVSFLGQRTDMPHIMRALDILLLPSISEPFGLVVTEAMASGVAVVATDAGGVREIVEHERTGLLTKSDDYASFVQALDRLILDTSLRQRLAEEGVREVQKRFTPDREASGIASVYAELFRFRGGV